MKKNALLVVSVLLISTNVLSGTIDAEALAKSILSKPTYTGDRTGSFNIVYGGQDISRGNIDLQSGKIDEAIAIA